MRLRFERQARRHGGLLLSGVWLFTAEPAEEKKKSTTYYFVFLFVFFHHLPFESDLVSFLLPSSGLIRRIGTLRESWRNIQISQRGDQFLEAQFVRRSEVK